MEKERYYNVEHTGKLFKCVSRIGDSAANQFMTANPDYGVLDVRGGDVVFMARMTDKGRAKTSKDHFKALAEDYNPKYDPWGYAMNAAFDIAAMCHIRGLPNRLDYSPGLGGPNIEDESNKDYMQRLDDAALDRLARFTDRVLNMLKRAGKDY